MLTVTMWKCPGNLVNPLVRAICYSGPLPSPKCVIRAILKRTVKASDVTSEAEYRRGDSKMNK